MSCRIPSWTLPFALAITSALPALAEEKKDANGDELIDMPDEYYAQKNAEEREQQQAKGDKKETPGYVPGYLREPGLGLSPHAPQLMPSIPGALTPSFGAPTRHGNLRFVFHGYLQATLRAGLGRRSEVAEGQHRTTFHADPVVPGGAYGWFDHTNTVPTPWAQLNFSYGNDIVKVNALLGAWSTTEADDAAGNYMGHAQQLFTDVYLTYTPKVDPVVLKINVGAFPDRYGFMSKWHQGAYGTSLIADIHGMGVTTTLELPFEGNFSFVTEAGFKGELAKAPLGTPQDGSSEYARSEEGSTWAGHAHFAVPIKDDRYIPAFHFVQSFSMDDRKDLPDDPSTDVNEAQQRKDGFLRIMGGDLRIEAERFGYLYIGASYIVAENANSLTDLVKILNAGSGKELNERYFGFESNGTGKLTLIGAQYTLSLGTLLRYPMAYFGVGPDLSISLFTIFGLSQSDVPTIGEHNLFKYGTEVLYSFSQYVAAAMRLDHVMPDLNKTSRSFGVISPKLIFRTDWVTRESLTLQYSYYAMGDGVMIQGDNRLMNVTSKRPDRHMVAVYGTIWW